MLQFLKAIEIVKAKPPLDHGDPIKPIEGLEGEHTCGSRSECARTGDPLIDMVLAMPIVQRNIDSPVIDRSYDVPYGAGASDPWEDPTIFVDRHVPPRITASRVSKPNQTVSFDPAEPFTVHEVLEQTVLDMLIQGGMDEPLAYKCAHFGWAEVAEGAWYAAHDIDRDDAERQEQIWLDKIQHEDPERPAPNLYVKPYPKHYVVLASDEPYEEPLPTPEEMAAARKIIAGVLSVEDPLAKAATTGTLYVRRQLLNAERLIEWAQNEGFKTTVQEGDMHVTIAFSRAELEWPAPEEDDGMTIEGGERSVVRLGDSDAVALAFEAPELSKRHAALREAGASWDYPSYIPHVTITWDAGDLDETNIRPYPGPLIFGPEIFESVKESWSDTIAEKHMENTTLDPRAIEALRKAGLYDGIEKFLKMQPSVGDVHVTTALGNDRKSRNFKATLADIRKPKEDDEGVTVDEGGVAKDAADWSIPVTIVKTEADQQLVFGWASISEKDGKLIVDKQDDIILPEDLEKAAYDYVLHSRVQGDLHERKGVGKLVESMVFTKQKQDLMKIDLGLVGWWVGFHVTDADVWKRIKKGELPELSIGGKAIRVPA